MRISRLTVEVALPPREGAVVLPGDISDILAGGDVDQLALALALVLRVLADRCAEARERRPGFFGCRA